MDTHISNINRYLERLTGAEREKHKVALYIPDHANAVLDAGCADGSITKSLAHIFPKTQFLGIDINTQFISRAQEQKDANTDNVDFECVYLRDLLAREKRYDAVTFISVLHEFYSYGEGISSVMKALADAHELLNPCGNIIIRDMIVPNYFSNSTDVAGLIRKIKTSENLTPYITSFEDRYGTLKCLREVNHFLLKYLYTDNWEHELQENYLAVSLEEYQQMFSLLGMETIYARSSLLSYLKNKWVDDFSLTEKEIDSLLSTTILVAEKK
jgi:2-polyprenyl-3-methyl-5-hydroxy-6-metoxy-1,4-benzoquinol methylase